MSVRSPSTLLRYLAPLLRPIALLCVRHGLKIQELFEASKRALLEAARAELIRQGVELNTSKLAVMTGLQRREVMRLLESPSDEGGQANLLLRIVGAWQQGKRYLDKRGKPMALDCEGAESAFAKLVQSVSQDLNPYTVLFELERVGVVTRVHGEARLVAQVYVPGDLDHSMELLTQDQEALVLGVAENIFDQPEVPHLHIATHYDNIPESRLGEIKEWLLRKGRDFHQEARAYLGGLDRDLNPDLPPGVGRGRVLVGTFSLSGVDGAAPPRGQAGAKGSPRSMRSRRGVRHAN